MSAGFTPGPWRFSWNSPNIAKQAPTSGTAWPDHKAAAGANRIDVSGPNTLANARLIAAAPELLEALEAAMHDLEPTLSSYQDARAAVAKARGDA